MKIKLRLISVALVLSMMIGAFSIQAFAAAVNGKYYNTNPQYTSISNTYGYIVGNYTGNYYYNGSVSNNAIIHAEARGGAISAFYTSLYIWIWDGVNVDERISHNTDEGNRLLSDTINVASNNIIGGANGYVEGVSYSITNSSDRWEYNYLYYWCGAQNGWN